MKHFFYHFTYVLVVSILLIKLPSLLATTQQVQSISYYTSLEKALKKSKSTHKPLFIFLNSRKCERCVDVWKDIRQQQCMHQKVVVVKINMDRNEKEAKDAFTMTGTQKKEGKLPWTGIVLPENKEVVVVEKLSEIKKAQKILHAVTKL